MILVLKPYVVPNSIIIIIYLRKKFLSIPSSIIELSVI